MPSEQKQTSSSESNPWGPSQASLTDLLSKAQKIGGNNSYFTPVQGTTTNQAMDQTKAIAQQGSAALDPLQSVVGGSTQGFGTGVDQLMATARGDNLGSVPPMLQAALDTASQNTANLTNQQFSGAGRYGSANHAGTIADRVGTIQTQGLLDNYNKERQNQLDASGTLNAGGYQGANLAPQIDNARLFTPQLLGQVGAQEDAYDTAVKQAPLRAAEWQAGQTLPIAGLGGTQSGTQTSKTSNPVGTAIGIGTTAAGLMTGGAGFGLMGAAGGMGGLSSLFGGGNMTGYGNSWSPYTQRA
jgi:hypothetical protein